MLSWSTMKSVSILLLVCLCACELDATELNNDVLRKIVDDFLAKARASKRGQFSFLIALNPQQCSYPQQVQYLRNNNCTSEPYISTSLNEFNAPLNYLAVYPRKGKVCSEKKILFGRRENRLLPEWFADKIDMKSQGGCVIFYTKNTPCIFHCFSKKEGEDISVPLLSKPFKDWTSDGQNAIHKYFVYTKIYEHDEGRKDKIISGFDCLDKSAQDPNGSFLFRRCRNNLPCDKCTRENSYCVNLNESISFGP